MSAEWGGPFGRISRDHAALAGIFVVTLLGLLSIGATLPILPRYVRGPIGAGDVAVGIVTGAFAITGLACRPLAGRYADRHGRRPAVLLGALSTATAGLLYFVPAGVPGLIVARLFLGAGEGTVYTAGSAWVVDLAPPNRRGHIIGLYGLAIWTGLSLGPPIGELLLHVGGYELVWAFAAGAPLIGALVAMRLPEAFEPREEAAADSRLIAREALGPGLGLSLGIIGFATLSAFIVLDLRELGFGHGAEVFTAFAVSVIVTRIALGWMPDRLGPIPCAAASGIVEAIGLVAIALAQSIWVALAGAIAMGAAFGLLFPSFALMVLNRVPDGRRGAAMGTFTAFFDIGFGLGAPLAGIAAAIGGYPAAFAFAAACSAAILAVVGSLRRGGAGQPVPT